jgi:phosphoribosylpyrophosphate synthetase
MAGRLDLSFARVRVHRFADGESLVRVETGPSGEAVLVHSLFSPNEKIFETTFAPVVRGLRRHGVRRIIAIVVHALFAPGGLARIRGAGGTQGDLVRHGSSSDERN